MCIPVSRCWKRLSGGESSSSILESRPWFYSGSPASPLGGFKGRTNPPEQISFLSAVGTTARASSAAGRTDSVSVCGAVTGTSQFPYKCVLPINLNDKEAYSLSLIFSLTLIQLICMCWWWCCIPKGWLQIFKCLYLPLTFAKQFVNDTILNEPAFHEL